jgi:hypothetical protein
MGWSAIIELILGLVGPFLTELLKKWLGGLLNKSAKKVRWSSDSADNTRRLIQQAIKDSPRRPFKWAILRKMEDILPAAVAAKKRKLAKADADEIAAYSDYAEDED